MITNKEYLDFIKQHYSKVIIRAIEYDLTHNGLQPFEKAQALQLKAYLERK